MAFGVWRDRERRFDFEIVGVWNTRLTRYIHHQVEDVRWKPAVCLEACLLSSITLYLAILPRHRDDVRSTINLENAHSTDATL